MRRECRHQESSYAVVSSDSPDLFQPMTPAAGHNFNSSLIVSPRHAKQDPETESDQLTRYGMRAAIIHYRAIKTVAPNLWSQSQEAAL